MCSKKDKTYLQCNALVILVTLMPGTNSRRQRVCNANIAIKNQLACNQMLCLQCNSNINAFLLQNQDNTYNKGQDCDDPLAINSVRGSYLRLNYSSNLTLSQHETNKHLWPIRCNCWNIVFILHFNS